MTEHSRNHSSGCYPAMSVLDEVDDTRKMWLSNKSK
jgi:hypothetical protein